MSSSKTAAHGPSCCEGVGTTMIGHFVTRLEVEAGKAGGSLTAAQIRALAQRFVATEQARFKGFYQRTWDECTIAREAHLLESARRMPFDRILMRRFAHLFPPRTGDDGGTGVLSRRIIPGLNIAIDKMIGPEMYRQSQALCEIILDRHAQDDGGWNWEAVHADSEARALVNEALVVVAGTFAAFERRRAWFIELVNANLTPVRRGASDEHFRLGESGFSALMRALFADLAAGLRAHPAEAVARWGAPTVEDLKAFFRRLEGA
ncbi:hypothetical protein CU669_15520 [Paramagnetospirillum kuznetsovii]|uniref:Uncharacterized protein n=1 Tax=Paramagnetospirillum kuznetsovii TaxID=2053833 RepID=A0A364NVB1_9PROT|nr:hypothetical protein [Paramagnetospirillum kuznetsovii]RAU20993.1 hypothetical protein CU669_15520 [Paramagnetospirillum kuznetsovii]